MRLDTPKISPLGQKALIVEFGRTISEKLNIEAIALAERLENEPFPGFIEAAAAYSSVYVGYDPDQVHRHIGAAKTAFETVVRFVRQCLIHPVPQAAADFEEHEIPVLFGGENGPDLSFVAKHAALTGDEVVDIFTSVSYRVYMLGFLPGFSYLGEIDQRIATARRAAPRTIVPKGSIGIADRQTGIYPRESPGGWQLIGRTDVEMFLPDSIPPCRMKPGDRVRFTAA